MLPFARRLAVSAALAATVLVASSGGALAGAPSQTGPACTDIIAGDPSYITIDPSTGSAVTPTFAMTQTQAAPACSNVRYTLYIANGDTGAPLATETGIVTAGSAIITYPTLTITDGSAPSSLCIYSTTSRGGKIFDRAPDAGCFIVVANSAPGFGYH